MNDASSDSEVERRLLERFRGGDGTAFDDRVVLHREAVYRVARRIVGEHAQADEVAQETFVRAWKALPGFRGEARLATWLVRIAINVARSAGAERGQTLRISGKREEKVPAEGSFHRRERRGSEFSRALQLPRELDPSRAEASSQNGILTIRVPLREESRPRRIDVRAA